MKIAEKYYKAIFVHEGLLWSIFATGKAGVLYYLNQWAKAPDWLADANYGLFVFSTLDDTRSFLKSNDRIYARTQIWECEVKEEIDLTHKKYLLTIPLRQGRLVPFGAIVKDELAWPDGTRMFEQVKLTKMVWDSKYGHV